MIATTVETIRDLGVPALVGSVVGALITHFAAKARGHEEHKRTVDLLVTQDERRAAHSALDAVREIKRRINAGSISDVELSNEWSDRVLVPARLIRSDALLERARAGEYVVFLPRSHPRSTSPSPRSAERWMSRNGWWRGSGERLRRHPSYRPRTRSGRSRGAREAAGSRLSR